MEEITHNTSCINDIVTRFLTSTVAIRVIQEPGNLWNELISKNKEETNKLLISIKLSDNMHLYMTSRFSTCNEATKKGNILEGRP